MTGPSARYGRNGRWLARRIKLLQAMWAVLRERPMILCVTLATFTALLAAGLASVLTAAAAAVSTAKDMAQHGLGNQVALSFREALLIATFGSELLAVSVKRTPRCPDLEANWAAITADIMERVDPVVVKQLELDPAGVIWKTDPPLQGAIADYLYGRDLLREASDRPGVLLVLRSRQTTIMGPYVCQGPFMCAFTVTPIFLPAPDEQYDWGCGYQPYDCPDGLCWDAANRTKFWGQVSTMLDLQPLLSGSDPRLRFLEQRGYLYKLWQAPTTASNPYFLLANTSRPPVDPVVLEIHVFNVEWYLAIAPAGGWSPPWRGPCAAAVVAGSGCVALLVMWLLVSREQHDRLLRAMLPPKVIKQLQSGETAIAQEYENVTILFSDIVGYTCVASQLSPRQVVVLLNELFSVFDELTHHNGVYKVETIGDALMCVAGAPVPDDPVRTACRMAHMALDMMAAVEQFRPSLEGVRVQIRVGVHSGPVVAGVVGRKMPRYCLFGDTVNTASRMESTSIPMQIQVSPATAALLAASGEDFALELRGPVNVKGKGTMDTYWLCGASSQPARHSQLLAALHHARPPSLIIRPPPSPPPQRAASRTMTAPAGGGSPRLSAAIDTAMSLPCFNEVQTYSQVRAAGSPLGPPLPLAAAPVTAQQLAGPARSAAGQPGDGQPPSAPSSAVTTAVPGASRGDVGASTPDAAAAAGPGAPSAGDGTPAVAEAEAAATDVEAAATEAGQVELEVDLGLSAVAQSTVRSSHPGYSPRASPQASQCVSPGPGPTPPPRRKAPPSPLQTPPHLKRRASAGAGDGSWGGALLPLPAAPSPPPPLTTSIPQTSPPLQQQLQQAGGGGGGAAATGSAASAAAAIFKGKACWGTCTPTPPSPFSRAPANVGRPGGGAASAAAAFPLTAANATAAPANAAPISPPRWPLLAGVASTRRSVGSLYVDAGRGGGSNDGYIGSGGGSLGGGGAGGSVSAVGFGHLATVRRALTRRLSMGRPEELRRLTRNATNASEAAVPLDALATAPGSLDGRMLFRLASRDRSSAGSGAFTALPSRLSGGGGERDEGEGEGEGEGGDGGGGGSVCGLLVVAAAGAGASRVGSRLGGGWSESGYRAVRD